MCSAVAFSVVAAEKISFKSSEVIFSDYKKHEVDIDSSTCDPMY
jgi:hypothetical protein